MTVDMFPFILIDEKLQVVGGIQPIVVNCIQENCKSYPDPGASITPVLPEGAVNR